jgi:ADP-dependent NAD(P)H-hydrate dehydratase / NAD(P)H-hydrate epimerase
MRGAFDVDSVRSAERRLMARLPDGALMERASVGLADICSALLRDVGPGVVGSRIVVLAGSGNNGGDALYAGALLVRRGAMVSAIKLGDSMHVGGLDALVSAGGRTINARDSLEASGLIADADLVLDGIVGIGGSGALRPLAAELVRCASDSGALVVAVDIPSGTDPNTGAVPDPTAAVDADVTVTFGCLKPGLLLAPARDRAGAVVLVDIGLGEELTSPTLHVLDHADVAACMPEPQPDDYKYSRGVVGIVAGSSRYRGAAYLTTASARQGGAGMVHYLDRGNGLASAVIDRFWDVVASTDRPESVARATAWGVGPGLGTDASALDALRDVMTTSIPVVADADALRLLATAEPGDLLPRSAPTVLTPHLGELEALGYSLGDGEVEDRLKVARAAARDLGVVMVVKGPGTVTASPSGLAFVDMEAGPELATAGSGDVLCGLTASLMASTAAREGGLDLDRATFVAAAAVALHGVAGRLAAAGGRPVTAMDVVDHLGAAVSLVRRGETP